MEDLLTYGEGLEVAERDLLVPEVGKQPQALPDQVIAVVRDGVVHRYFDPAVTQLVRGDRLVVVRPAEELPWAPRPGHARGGASPTRRSDPEVAQRGSRSSTWLLRATAAMAMPVKASARAIRRITCPTWPRTPSTGISMTNAISATGTHSAVARATSRAIATRTEPR